MNNSDKLIYTQGNASTFARGADGRLVYNGIDGEDKKYLIEGEGGGSSAPSSLIEPQLDNFEYINTSYNDYTHTITISTKRASSDYSGLKYIDKIDGYEDEIISINSNGAIDEYNRSLSLNKFNDVTINCTEYYIKNGNNYRFKSTHLSKYDEENPGEYVADDFELTGYGPNAHSKIYTDMNSVGGKMELIFGTEYADPGIGKREFIIRFSGQGGAEDVLFQIIGKVFDEVGEIISETPVFSASIASDGTVSLNNVSI